MKQNDVLEKGIAVMKIKQCFLCIAVVALCVNFFSCAGIIGVAPAGLLYTDVKVPAPRLEVPMNDTLRSPFRQGEATLTSLLGLFTTGDASIRTAMKNGNITKIHHVDYHVTNFLGIFATFTTQIYGE